MGLLFGLLGGTLLIVDGILDLVSGVVFLALGRGLRAVDSWDQAVIFIVVGLLIAFFAVLGRSSRSTERPVAAGAVLVVLAVVGWFVLGFSNGVLALIASVFVLVGGILFLVSRH